MPGYEQPTSGDDEVRPVCSACEGELIATQVDNQLFVRRRGDTTGAAWSATQLDAWTCLGCGQTDLYATEPGRLAA